MEVKKKKNSIVIFRVITDSELLRLSYPDQRNDMCTKQQRTYKGEDTFSGMEVGN